MGQSRRHRALPVNIIGVISQILPGRCVQRFGGQYNPVTVQRVIIPPILKILFQPWAHNHSFLIGINRNVTQIKQAMKIAPQENSVCWRMEPALRVWMEVGGIQNGQGPLSCHRTAAVVRFCDQQPESTLTIARQDCDWVSETRTLDDRTRGGSRSHSLGDLRCQLFPDLLPE